MPGYIWDNWHVKSLTSVNFIDFITLSSARCGSLELDWLKCADRVGLMHSREKCKELFEDYQECAMRIKTKRRAQFIKYEVFKAAFRGDASTERPEDPK